MVDNSRALIEDCCGWNRKTWADAVEYALSQLPERLDGKKVLEIGASPYSSMCPIFASKGADVLCSYYGGGEQQYTRHNIENGRLLFVEDKYHMAKISVEERNIYNLQGTYDSIVMKSVLGAIFRNDDYEGLRLAMDRLLKENVNQGGFIVSFDNGYMRLFTQLRSLWGTGKQGFAYFNRNKLLEYLADYDIQIKGFGYINVGTPTALVKRNIEFVNDMIYLIDKIDLSLIKPVDRVVLSIIIRKT